MKKTLTILSVISVVGVAKAADITIYFSPSCPHCHHAMEYMDKNMPGDKYDKVDVSKMENREVFVAAIQKCRLDSGGVPLVVIGKKCMQGFGPDTGLEYRAELAKLKTAKTAVVATDETGEVIAVEPPVKHARVETEKRVGYAFWLALGAFALALGAFVVARSRRKCKC